MIQKPPDSRPENPFLAYIRRFRFNPIKQKHPVPAQSPSARDDAGAFFTREYLPFLSAAFEIWQQDDFWEGDADDIQQAKDWMSELETMLMAGNCGKSRSPLFDAATLVLREVFQDQFDTGGLDELAPDRPDTYWDEDTGDTGDEIEQRELALCLACQDYVTQMMFQAFDAILDAGISVFAGGTVMSLVVGVPGALAVSALGAIWGLSLATLQQDNVRDAIACCMHSELEGVAISEASFKAALDAACDVPFSPPGDAVHFYVKATLQDSQNYLAFVNMLGSFNDVAGSGIIGCLCNEWEHTFDFTIENDGWVTRAEDARDFGDYVGGTGWVSEYDPGEEAERLYIQREWTPDTLLTKAQVFYTLEGPSGPNRAVTIHLKDDTVTQDSDTDTFITPGEFVHDWDFRETGDELEQSINMNTDGDEATFTITKIILSGEGVDPFS
jgi:hypothetical protein